MTWTKLSIEKFNQLKEIILDTEIADEDKVLYYIQIIFEVNPYHLQMKDFNTYLKELSFISSKIPKMKVQKSYTLNNTKYILNSKLIGFNVAQWIDYQAHLKNGTDSENFSNLLSCVLVPEGKEYNEGYNIEDVVRDINKYMSIAEGLAIANFFLRFQKALLILSLLSIRKKTLKSPLSWKERKKVKKEYRQAIKTIISGD